MPVFNLNDQLKRVRFSGSSISCGLARSRSLVGEKPTQVTASHGPGIQPGVEFVAPPGNQAATEKTNINLYHSENPVYSPKVGPALQEGTRVRPQRAVAQII